MFYFLNHTILTTALPFLIRIGFIVLIFPFGDFIFNFESLLLVSSLLPVKPEHGTSLTPADRISFSFSKELSQILVGLLLGDLYACKQSKNVHLQFKQGVIHSDYLFHLYELFQEYCLSAPKTFDSLAHKRTGKVYSYVQFRTISLPCFNELYNLFYHEGKKVVPLNIAELFTPLSLAYWLSDDGSFIKSHGSIILCTDGFTHAEVVLLASVLNTK